MPSDAVSFLTLDEALAIHARLLEVFGGMPGLRDPGLLESALYRPRSGCYRDLAEMATALFESLILNHPFLEGKKRVAFCATDALLHLNGWKLQVEPNEAHAFLIRLLDDGSCDAEHLVPWIRRALIPLDEYGQADDRSPVFAQLQQASLPPVR